MHTRRSFVLASCAAAAGCGRRRAAGFNGYAFVANQEGRAIAVVDLTAFAVARHIRVEGGPSSVIAHPSLASVYVLTADTGTVHEIGTANLAVRRSSRVARAAVSMRLTPDGSTLWVLCRDPWQLVPVPVDRLQPGRAIRLPAEPVDFDLTAGAQWTYWKRHWAAVSFGDAGSVGMADLDARTIKTVHIGRKLSLVRFRADAGQMLVGNIEDKFLTILAWPSGKLVVNLPLAVEPTNFCMKGDGGQLFVTGDGMDAVAVVYPFTTDVAETMLAGNSPGAMAEFTSEEASFLFVANPHSGEVTVLDMEARRAIAVVGVGRSPNFITVTPDGQYALVLNQASGDMAIIRMVTIAAGRAKSAPLFTLIPVGSKPVSAAVRGV